MANQIRPRIAPAKTIKEAQAQAKTLGVDADYSHFDLETANMVNAALDETKQLFPGITVPSVRTMQSCDEAVLRRAAQLAETNPRFLGLLPGATEPTKRIMTAVSAEEVARGIKADAEKAFAIFHSREYGIFVNEDYAKDNERFNREKARRKDLGWSAVGSAKGTVDHEIGHQLDDVLGISGKPEVLSLYRGSGGMEGIQSGLSGNAAKKPQEFVAEAWSEYRNSASPRPIARQVGDWVIDAYEKQYGGAVT